MAKILNSMCRYISQRLVKKKRPVWIYEFDFPGLADEGHSTTGGGEGGGGGGG